MVIAVVQAIGFFNSFNNPIIYAFMNENFKQSCLSTLSGCLLKRTHHHHQGGANNQPNHSVQFSKRLRWGPFQSNSVGHANSQQNLADTGGSSSSNTDAFSAFPEVKISGITSQLPANGSHVK